MLGERRRQAQQGYYFTEESSSGSTSSSLGSKTIQEDDPFRTDLTVSDMMNGQGRRVRDTAVCEHDTR